MFTPGVLPLIYSEPFHAPDFLREAAAGSGQHSGGVTIPSTVTASGYVQGMPVALDPVPTPRRQAAAPPLEQANEQQSEGSRRRGKASERRSTLPEHHALRGMIMPPPLLHSSLTPSCERCAADADTEGSSGVQASQVYCFECESFLCGSEAVEDGMPRTGDKVADRARSQHNGCNLRMHRHQVMQGHVRVAASTMMQLSKLETEEATKPAAQRRGRKELLLHLFALPMRHVIWQYRSLAPSTVAAVDEDDDEEQHLHSDGWIEFDLLAQHKLEQAFGADAAASDDRSNDVALSEQYVVSRASAVSAAGSNAHAAEFVQINTLDKTRYPVRRLDLDQLPPSLRHTFGGGSSLRPNTRPSSAATSPRNSAPPSPSTRSWRRAVPATPLSVNLPPGAFAASTPLYSTSASVASARFPFSNGGVAPLPLESPQITARGAGAGSVSATPRPGLARHASIDAVLMRDYSDYTAVQWIAFAHAQPSRVRNGDVGAHLDELPSGEEELFPLYDMERGNALLLAVYHNARDAVAILLQKGYSAARSLTSWTHLSSLQLAAMQGNDDVAAMLLQAGADPAYHSSTPTMAMEYAAKSGCLPLLRRLLDIRRATGARLSHSDVLLHEAKRKAKRSTWVDIADEAETGGGAKGAQAGVAAVAASSSSASNASPKDPDFQLYPHLLTEALNVPPIQAHSLEVVRFLLDKMLSRAEERRESGADAPKFELSRYFEWMSACVSSSSPERVRFLVSSWSHYTRHLALLRSVSEVFEEHLSDERYARAVLDFQPSIDALFFQTCTQHPASESEEDADNAANDEHQDESSESIESLGASVDATSSSGSFEMLRFLLDEAGADVNVVLRDNSDGTELTPLLMAIRDRKPFLTPFLVARGADTERRQRCTLVELPHESVLTDLYPPVQRAEDGRAYQMLLPLEFARDECAYDPDELDTLQVGLDEGLARRHSAAHDLVRVVLDVTRQMAGLPSISDEFEGDGTVDELLSPAPVALSPTAPPVTLSEPFNVLTLHIIAAYCYGSHALTIGADISAATGIALSRPVSPAPSP